MIFFLSYIQCLNFYLVTISILQGFFFFFFWVPLLGLEGWSPLEVETTSLKGLEEVKNQSAF